MAVTIKTNPEQLAILRSQMDEANRKSHFVIFESTERQSGDSLRLITDYESFREIQQEHGDQADMHILQDIVPITDNLAKWAIAESQAARANDDPSVLADLEHFTNEVLMENHLAVNKEDA
ncbi:hypothetical protein FC82_GL002094 [Secundilactobacillus collinoides DSM 20515 = JCM 1123]|uniref:Uncharacterized protein n=1 Tax=Secundilactobacillus collinoides DSM 20515 = JCM 1123 TaxID=1423733 RepID=A0A0R2B902_SECCO|nr:hypothetical protein FC82_GL002094 [Secundilactobacillus collinoides DSM 20515 = JCM 1123]